MRRGQQLVGCCRRRVRRRLTLASAAMALVLAALPALAQGGDIDARLAEAVAARQAGAFDRALALLTELAEAAPDNADVQVQLGFAALALDHRDVAEAAFRRTLALAPDYVDANFGLAQVAYRRGDLTTAATEARVVLAAREDTEAAALIDRIAAARKAAVRPVTAAVPSAAPAAPEIRHWRVDFDGIFSNLSTGYADWAEARLAITHRRDMALAASFAAQLSRRFDRTDLYIEGRIDRRLSDWFSFYTYLGGTPDADFRPRLAYGGGLAARLHEGHDGWGPGLATFDVADAHYVNDRVLTLSPGWQQYLWDGRAWLTFRWINSFVELEAHHMGYAIRGDLQITDRLRVNAGYSDAPDTSDGVTVDVRSVFGGLSFAATDEIIMRAVVSYETRSQGYDRSVLTVGFSSAF